MIYTLTNIGDIAGPVNLQSLNSVHVKGSTKLIAERSLDNINWADGGGTSVLESELFRLRAIEPGVTTVEFTM